MANVPGLRRCRRCGPPPTRDQPSPTTANGNAAEFAQPGILPADRAARSEETIRACRELWSPGLSSFAGRWITFTDVICEPAPAAPGGVPVCWGGDALSTAVARRVVTLGEGWPSREAADDDQMSATRRRPPPAASITRRPQPAASPTQRVPHPPRPPPATSATSAPSRRVTGKILEKKRTYRTLFFHQENSFQDHCSNRMKNKIKRPSHGRVRALISCGGNPWPRVPRPFRWT